MLTVVRIFFCVNSVSAIIFLNSSANAIPLSRGLFSRGNTDNDLLYAHGYGVGYPGASGVDSNGPTQGQVGFGILGSWFASGVVYGTPVLAGLQLNIGIFDPAVIVGAWPRTKWVRPEGELMVIHWRYDPATPRGPNLEIRPRPEQIAGWAEETKLIEADGPVIDLPPWHFGLRLRRRKSSGG